MQRETTSQTPAPSSKTTMVSKTPARSVPQPLTESQLRQVGGGVNVPTAPNKTW